MVEPSRLVQHPAGAAMGPVGNTAQVNCTTQEAMEGGDAGAVGHHPPSPGDAFQQALDQPAGNGGVDRLPHLMLSLMQYAQSTPAELCDPLLLDAYACALSEEACR